MPAGDRPIVKHGVAVCLDCKLKFEFDHHARCKSCRKARRKQRTSRASAYYEARAAQAKFNRAKIYAYYQEGMMSLEIAAIVGSSVSAVNRAINRERIERAKQVSNPSSAE